MITCFAVRYLAFMIISLSIEALKLVAYRVIHGNNVFLFDARSFLKRRKIMGSACSNIVFERMVTKVRGRIQKLK